MVPQSEGISWRALLSRGNVSLLAVIFLLALLSRLIFLSTVQQIPVVWDARIYASAGLGLLGYLDDDGDQAFARNTGDEEEFKNCYLKYIDGEDIEWLYYKPPSMAESQKYLFYSGPVYPAIMAGFMAMEWDNDFQIIRYFNTLIDSLTIVLISLLALMLWGKRSAVIITALIQLAYWPLVLTCGLLTLETITSFIISLLLLFVLLFYYNKNRYLIFISGLIAGLLFLTKPTAVLLAAPVLLFLVFVFRSDRKLIINTVLLFAIGLAVFAVPWTVFTSDYYDRFAIRDPEYANANFRSSSAIEFEGYDLDYTDSDFWTYPLFDRVTSDPLGYGQLLIKKLIRLWWTPHDEFWQGPKLFEIFLHRCIVLLSLFGMTAMLFQRKWKLLLPLLIVLYYTTLHTIFHSVPRYNFNALPGLFLIATNGLVFASSRLRLLTEKKVQLFYFCGLVALLVLVNLQILERWLVSLAPATIWMIVTIGLLLYAGVLYSRLFFGGNSSDQKAGWNKLAIWLPIGILILTSSVGWNRDHLKEWSVSINRSDEVLVTEIKMPIGFALSKDDRVRLVIDMTSLPGQATPVDVDLNGLKFRFDDATAPIDKNFYIKGSYGAIERIMKLDNASLRWYRMIELDPDLIRLALSNSSVLKISIALADSIGQSRITIYGDSDSNYTPEIRVPSFTHKSIERFKELGDRRVYETYNVNSVSSSSYKTGADHKQKQLPGRMRVFLIVYGADFTKSHY